MQPAALTGRRASLVSSSSHADLFRQRLPLRCLAPSIPVPIQRRYIHQEKKKANGSIDRDLIVSVLESANKRDARSYFKKYVGHLDAQKANPSPTLDLPGTIKNRALFVQGGEQVESGAAPSEALHVAVVKLCRPQTIDDSTMEGVAKTLSQLRMLGLLSVVVIDCGSESPGALRSEQATRLAYLLDTFDGQSATVIQNFLLVDSSPAHSSTTASSSLDVTYIRRVLDAGKIPIINDHYPKRGADSSKEPPPESVIVTLTRLLSTSEHAHAGVPSEPPATIESVIVLDPAGGIPMANDAGVTHRFVNLEQEFDSILASLSEQRPRPNTPDSGRSLEISESHAQNLGMVKDILSILPPAASALITSPLLAATISRPEAVSQQPAWKEQERQHAGFATVRTRPTKNPLIHHLLTDKPVYSPSLPVDKISRRGPNGGHTPNTEMATLLKRGMPVTILGGTGSRPWTPLKPGTRRLRLSDPDVDLKRLTYLIEDSFGRKLDVEDYLRRVDDRIAGIIVAGEYEGGAILTWEKPFGLSEEEAYETGRFVPYLDKFAVLRSRQGSGGVADIVFNAMVQDCFPHGVCWRSRKDNPVNKWYFERSIGGTKKLEETNWAMFWTTRGLQLGSQQIMDYEDVCRQTQPSWERQGE